jgi:hypothetical protein
MDELEARVARLNKIISRLGNPIDGSVATDRFLIEYAKLLSDMGITSSDLPIVRHNTVVKSRYRPELLAFARKQHIRLQKLKKRRQELMNTNSQQVVPDFKSVATKVLKQIMGAIESGTEPTDLILIEFAITDKELREKITAQNQSIERLMREVAEITAKKEAAAEVQGVSPAEIRHASAAQPVGKHPKPNHQHQQKTTGGLLLGRYSRRRLNTFSDELAAILEPYHRQYLNVAALAESEHVDSELASDRYRKFLPVVPDKLSVDLGSAFVQLSGDLEWDSKEVVPHATIMFMALVRNQLDLPLQRLRTVPSDEAFDKTVSGIWWKHPTSMYQWTVLALTAGALQHLLRVRVTACDEGHPTNNAQA